MIRAYDENMRPKAQATLGAAFDYAAREMGYLPIDFAAMFVESGIARRFERGDVSVIMGKSGIELVLLVAEETVGVHREFSLHRLVSRGREYWIGWALAYYQCETGRTFSEILQAVSMEVIDALYEAYHEMDIRSFADHMEMLVERALPQTNLQRLRRRIGLTQDELARRSGISVRTIQQYEQRRKDVNKAQLETALRLAQALHCEPSQLFERRAS